MNHEDTQEHKTSSSQDGYWHNISKYLISYEVNPKKKNGLNLTRSTLVANEEDWGRDDIHFRVKRESRKKEKC